jgi:hypothetical protein
VNNEVKQSIVAVRWLCMVIFDPMVYPMDTAWLDGTIPADHYRYTRPAYYRELSRKGLVQETAENDALPNVLPPGPQGP